MQVGTERKRAHAGIEHLLGDLEAEVRPVADVDANAAVDRLEHDRVHIALFGDETAGVARERMGERVARLHDRH